MKSLPLITMFLFSNLLIKANRFFLLVVVVVAVVFALVHLKSTLFCCENDVKWKKNAQYEEREKNVADMK